MWQFTYSSAFLLVSTPSTTKTAAIFFTLVWLDTDTKRRPQMAFFILTAVRCCLCYVAVTWLAACYLRPLIRTCHRERVCGYKTNALHALRLPVMHKVTELRIHIGEKPFSKTIRNYALDISVSHYYIKCMVSSRKLLCWGGKLSILISCLLISFANNKCW